MLSVAWVLPALLLPACSRTQETDAIAAAVKEQIAQRCKTDHEYADLEVAAVALASDRTGRFTGYVEFRYRGEIERTKLIVTSGTDDSLSIHDPPRALIMKRDDSRGQTPAR